MLPAVLQARAGRNSRATPSARPNSRSRAAGAAVGAAALSFLLLGPVQAVEAPASFAALAEKVTPAVVNISSEHRVAGPRISPPDVPEGSPFDEFFRQFQDRFGHGPGPGTTARALGSGFIIDPSGYVVTNNHVVDAADNISVTLTTGQSFPAKLVGADKRTDLALLKIESDGPLPAVSFGDSDSLKVGDWVMAIGNPFGLGGTVTAGILSARGRDLHAGPFDDFLQIDAAINQGNSGGPTFAMDGTVVGVNTAIASPNGGSVGIGFAIPANVAKPVIAALREHGFVERGWLGVQIQAVTPEIAAAAGLEEAKGAIVSDVVPGSPAAKAGLKRGDIILAFDANAIEEMRDLPRLVAAVAVGAKVDVEVWRARETKTVSVEIARLREDEVAANDKAPIAPGAATVAPLGLTLAELTPELRDRLGIPQGVDGVVITGVADEGPAAAKGLRRGDVIRQVGSEPVTTPEHVKSLTEAARAENQKAVLMLIDRGGSQLFVAVKIA